MTEPNANPKTDAKHGQDGDAVPHTAHEAASAEPVHAEPEHPVPPHAEAEHADPKPAAPEPAEPVLTEPAFAFTAKPAAPESVPTPAEPAFAAPTSLPPPVRSGPGGTPIWLTGLLFVVLAGGIGYLFAVQLSGPSAGPADSQKIAALDDALRATQQKLAALEQRPAAAIDLAPLAGRIAGLEAALRAQAQHPAGGGDTSALDSRIAALEQRPAAPDMTAPIAAATASLTAKLADLETRLQQVASQDAARAAATARLRAASVALESGQKIGDLPGAPPALTRFANAAPPTEAALRLSFPAAASAAEAASVPQSDGFSFVERMWRRAQSLVTVRQGDKVLVGAPAAVTLNAARARLDAGDLAGAVAALGGLDGPAAKAMAGWRSDAQALVDARAALAALGTRS